MSCSSQDQPHHHQLSHQQRLCSLLVVEGVAAANLHTKPQQAASISGNSFLSRAAHKIPSKGEGDQSSDAPSWSQAITTATLLHKRLVLTYLPRITQGNCFHKEPCAHIPSHGPFSQRDWGKTSWWKYARMVSTGLLIFRTSTSILKWGFLLAFYCPDSKTALWENAQNKAE